MRAALSRAVFSGILQHLKNTDRKMARGAVQSLKGKEMSWNAIRSVPSRRPTPVWFQRRTCANACGCVSSGPVCDGLRPTAKSLLAATVGRVYESVAAVGRCGALSAASENECTAAVV